MGRLEVFGVAAGDPDPRAQRRLIDAARRGELLRLTPGRYVVRAVFATATEHERHRARIDAVMPWTSGDLIVSHHSAVVLHDLPWLGETPELVAVLDPKRRNGQRRAHLQKVGAAERIVEPVHIGGYAVTPLTVTAVDVALREPFRTAIVVLDAVLARGVSKDELLAELARRTPRPRASSRARRAIEFADGLAGSPGESVARLRWAEEGFPPPALQREFRDAEGLIGRVDFWFPEAGVVVEFDGLVKYRDREMRGGRTPERVVMDEKLREDRLRAVPEIRSVVRVTWRDVEPGGSAPARLERAGIARLS